MTTGGGYHIDQFLDAKLNKEFLCCICKHVLRNPIISESCEHIYCTSCITAWTSSSNTCPIDGEPIAGLKTPIRPFMNLYNEIRIRCGFKGCDTVSSLGQIEDHANSCEYNPEASNGCVHGCGAVGLRVKDSASHSCIQYLKGEIIRKDLIIVNLKQVHSKEMRNKQEAWDTKVRGRDGAIAELKAELEKLRHESTHAAVLKTEKEKKDKKTTGVAGSKRSQTFDLLDTSSDDDGDDKDYKGKTEGGGVGKSKVDKSKRSNSSTNDK